ncbi:MAG TPA: GNAT family N-acetyltransferase [Gemmatimonadales bacterium]|nr:GNAT family N-acetyltransferase [Gemmatimonadales bacterium]
MSALPLVGEQGAGSGTMRGEPEARLAKEGTAPRSLLPLVRAARLADVPQLECLMAPYVATGDLLPRSNYDLCRHIKEYVVAEAAGGGIAGCASLKIYSRDLGEVAGLAVHPDHQGTGVGRALLAALIAEARTQGLSEVLALTRKPAFFFRLGFVPAEKEHFPLKVWADCARCPRQNCCDEVAVVLRL